MTTAQVIETSVTVKNSLIQDYVHPDDHAQPTYEMTPGFFWERLNIRDCYMKSYLSSLVLSSSFTDLVVRKRRKLIEFAEKTSLFGFVITLRTKDCGH